VSGDRKGHKRPKGDGAPSVQRKGSVRVGDGSTVKHAADALVGPEVAVSTKQIVAGLLHNPRHTGGQVSSTYVVEPGSRKADLLEKAGAEEKNRLAVLGERRIALQRKRALQISRKVSLVSWLSGPSRHPSTFLPSK
jgi:hypothetical protein